MIKQFFFKYENKKKAIVFVAFVICSFFVILHLYKISHGYCFEEKRYLKAQEILERYVLGPEWLGMTELERQNKLKEIPNFPECCTLTGRSEDFTKYFGFYHYKVEAVLPRDKSRFLKDARLTEYIHINSDIDACGIKMDGEPSFDYMSKENYFKYLEAHRPY